MSSIDWKIASQANTMSLRSWLPTMTLLLGLVYLAYPVYYLTFTSVPVLLSLVHALSGVLLVGLALATRKRDIPLRWVNPWLLLIVVIVVTNMNMAYAMTRDNHFALGNVFAQMAAALAPTLAWFLFFAVANVAACVAVTLIADISVPWALGMLGFITTTMIGGIMFVGRMHYVARMETLQRQLEESRDRDFREIIEKNPDAVILVRDGTIAYASAPLARYLGLASADEAIGKPLDSLVAEGNDALHDLLRGHPREPTCIVKLARSKGEPISVDVAEPKQITFEGAPAVLLVARDVTASQEILTARLLVADRLSAAGTLAGGVAHEINNPLTYVSINVQELIHMLAPQGDPEVDQLLTETLEGVERVATIVKDLHGIARTAGGTQRAPDPAASVSTAIKMVDNQLRHRTRVELDLEPLPAVNCDEGKLVQVLVNLLINAAHAVDEVPPDDRLIRVRTHQIGSDAVIEVSDSGCGMADGVKKRVFDPFFTTKPTGSGTGLGLFFCHNVVDAAGGRIDVTSQVGEGTTMRVVLPAAESNTLARPTSSPERADRNGPASILVVDDDPFVGKAIARVLDAHEVTVVTSGEAALEAFRRTPYELLLCDIMMPGMSGKALYEALCLLDPKVAERVVFLSGGAFTAEMKEFAETVTQKIVRKPVKHSQLLELAVAAVAARGDDMTSASR